MIKLWYCCSCSFGPHNAFLHEDCIQCGTPRCGRCIEQQPFETLPVEVPPARPMTPEIPNPGRSHNSIEETAHAQVNTSAGPDHAGDSEETPSGLQTSQAENTDGTGSFSRDLELTRQELSTSPVTLPGSTTNDNGNIPILKPQALSPGTANECSSAKFIVYSPSLGSTLADWVYKQFSQGLYSSAELRVLENVISELENTQPEFIFIGFDEDVAFWNTLKGNAEGILGSLDWWPFQSYIAPLDQDQTRISWKCPCGDERLATVPLSLD